MFSLCSLTFITKVYRSFVFLCIRAVESLMHFHLATAQLNYWSFYPYFFYFTFIFSISSIWLVWASHIPIWALGGQWFLSHFYYFIWLECSDIQWIFPVKNRMCELLWICYFEMLSTPEYSDGAFWISCSFLSLKQNTYAISDMALFPVFF